MATKKKKHSALPHIPEEIIAEILSKLPVKSLMRFKCVSNSWQSLISDSKFSLSRKSRERGFFYLQPSNEGKISFYSVDNDLVVEQVPSPCENCLSQENFTFHGSCNGLLIFTVSNSIYLWNPSTRCCKKVFQFDLWAEKFEPIVCGLCFDDSTDDYKVVIALQDLRIDKDKRFVLVGSLRSKLWVEVNFPYATIRSGCFVNGNLHWIVQEEAGGSHQIVYFDAKANKFNQLPIPNSDTFINQLGVLDGCLSMAQWCQGKVEISIMRKYGVKESWTTVFKCSQPRMKGRGQFVQVPGYSLATSKELLVAKFRDVWGMSFWDMEDNIFKSFKNIDLHGINYCDFFVWNTYFENVASVGGIYPLGSKIRWLDGAKA